MNRMFSLRRDDERDTPADGPAQRRGDPLFRRKRITFTFQQNL